jgi:hypothetical protein
MAADLEAWAVVTDLVTTSADGLHCAAGGFHVDPVGPVARAVITHAHGDHFGDTLDLVKKHSCDVVAPVELAWSLQKQDLEKVHDPNKGGTVDVDGLKFTMTNAFHSSSNDEGAYMGEPCGIVLTLEDDTKVYFAGDLNVKARDIVNLTNRAANLQYFGINPPAGQVKNIDVAPPGDFTCAIYAPGHDMDVHGNPDLIGAFVAKSISLNGNCSVHYDESLADDDGIITGFKVAHWLEDVR